MKTRPRTLQLHRARGVGKPLSALQWAHDLSTALLPGLPQAVFLVLEARSGYSTYTISSINHSPRVPVPRGGNCLVDPLTLRLLFLREKNPC